MSNNLSEGKGVETPSRNSYQLSIFELVLPSTDGLTTEKVSQLLGLPIPTLRKCRKQQFLEHGAFVLLHKGRDKWRLIKT